MTQHKQQKSKRRLRLESLESRSVMAAEFVPEFASDSNVDLQSLAATEFKDDPSLGEPAIFAVGDGVPWRLHGRKTDRIAPENLDWATIVPESFGGSLRLGTAEFRLAPRWEHFVQAEIPGEIVVDDPVSVGDSPDSIQDGGFDDSSSVSVTPPSGVSPQQSDTSSDHDLPTTSSGGIDAIVEVKSWESSASPSSSGVVETFVRTGALIELPIRQLALSRPDAASSSAPYFRSASPSTSRRFESDGLKEPLGTQPNPETIEPHADLADQGAAYSDDWEIEIPLLSPTGPATRPAYYLQFAQSVEERFAAEFGYPAIGAQMASAETKSLANVSAPIERDGGLIELASSNSPAGESRASTGVSSGDSSISPTSGPSVREIQVDSGLGLFQTLEVAISAADFSVVEPSQAIAFPLVFTIISEIFRRRKRPTLLAVNDDVRTVALDNGGTG